MIAMTLVLATLAASNDPFDDVFLRKPAAPQTAWLCRSKIGGTITMFGPLHHQSVAFCP